MCLPNLLRDTPKHIADFPPILTHSDNECPTLYSSLVRAMNKIIESLKKHLQRQHCLFDLDRKTATIHFGMEGTNARWRAMGLGDDAGRFVLVSLIPFMASEQRRSACAELMARINFRLGLGHFDIDFKDGELRFITTVPLAGEAALAEEVIEHVIRGHHTLVDSFIPAISAVLFTGMTPEKALTLDEQQQSTSPTKPRFSLN